MHLVMFLKGKEPRAGVLDGGEVIDINACDRSLPTSAFARRWANRSMAPATRSRSW